MKNCGRPAWHGPLRHSRIIRSLALAQLFHGIKNTGWPLGPISVEARPDQCSGSSDGKNENNPSLKGTLGLGRLAVCRIGRQCLLWVTCGRRLGKNFLTACSIGRVRSRVRPVDAAGMAAGPNALRGTDPKQKGALGSAMTQTGFPVPRNDRICITSSCPRQLVVPPARCLCGQQAMHL
jgi:hypothetical protein